MTQAHISISHILRNSIAIIAAALLCSACFDITSEIHINGDGSGYVDSQISVTAGLLAFAEQNFQGEFCPNIPVPENAADTINMTTLSGPASKAPVNGDCTYRMKETFRNFRGLKDRVSNSPKEIKEFEDQMKAIFPDTDPGVFSNTMANALTIKDLGQGRVRLLFDYLSYKNAIFGKANQGMPDLGLDFRKLYVVLFAGRKMKVTVSGNEIIHTTGVISKDRKRASFEMNLVDLFDPDFREGGKFDTTLRYVPESSVIDPLRNWFSGNAPKM